MKYPDLLIGIRPDGTVYGVLNEYEQIRAFIGNIIQFMHRGEGAHAIGMIIDEEGLMQPQLDFNMAASLIMQYPIYGPAIVCESETDHEGDTLPPNRRLREHAEGIAEIVSALITNADAVGQDLTLHPNPDTVPPPKIFTGGDFEDLMRELMGDRHDPDPD
jgi:hypothetical protein